MIFAREIKPTFNAKKVNLEITKFLLYFFEESFSQCVVLLKAMKNTERLKCFWRLPALHQKMVLEQIFGENFKLSELLNG